MRNPIALLWNDERGLIISAELVLILTIAVLGMVVGLNSVSTSVNNELNDLAGAFGSLNQSFHYRGLTKWGHASVAGAGYADSRDFCDCTILTVTEAGIHRHAGPVVAAPIAVLPSPCATGNCPDDPAPCTSGTCTDVPTPCPTGDCQAGEKPCDTCRTLPMHAPKLRKPATRHHHKHKSAHKHGPRRDKKHASPKKK